MDSSQFLAVSEETADKIHKMIQEDHKKNCRKNVI